MTPLKSNALAITTSGRYMLPLICLSTFNNRSPCIRKLNSTFNEEGGYDLFGAAILFSIFKHFSIFCSCKI